MPAMLKTSANDDNFQLIDSVAFLRAISRARTMIVIGIRMTSKKLR
jgi:hypothetical protein